MKRRKDNCAGHILRRNCLINHFFKGDVEGRREVTERRGRRREQLLDLKENRLYWNLKE
jgi:hypothetical protein